VRVLAASQFFFLKKALDPIAKNIEINP